MSVPTEHTRHAIVRDLALLDIEWLARRHRSGRVREYHRGYLAKDRESDLLAHTLGTLFWAAAQAGLVMLTQRRDSYDPGFHTYLATRTDVRLSVRMRAALERLINEVELPNVQPDGTVDCGVSQVAEVVEG